MELCFKKAPKRSFLHVDNVFLLSLPVGKILGAHRHEEEKKT